MTPSRSARNSRAGGVRPGPHMENEPPSAENTRAETCEACGKPPTTCWDWISCPLPDNAHHALIAQLTRERDEAREREEKLRSRIEALLKWAETEELHAISWGNDWVEPNITSITSQSSVGGKGVGEKIVGGHHRGEPLVTGYSPDKQPYPAPNLMEDICPGCPCCAKFNLCPDPRIWAENGFKGLDVAAVFIAHHNYEKLLRAENERLRVAIAQETQDHKPSRATGKPCGCFLCAALCPDVGRALEREGK